MTPLPSDMFDRADADALQVRAYLAGLPDAAPPDALWQRLQQAQRRRSAGHRLRPWLALAATVAAAAILGTTLLPRAQDDALVQHPPAPPMRSERDHADPVAVDRLGRASLARIDAELERAYAANASDEALQALLDVRAGVVDGLAAGESPQLLQL